MKEHVDSFVKGAEQFDDITMLCFEYRKTDEDAEMSITGMQELEIDALIENLPVVTDFIEKILDRTGCSRKSRHEIIIAVEEIFVNIARYAYQPDTGKATIRAEIENDPLRITITFIDQGVPYDPTAKVDPDVTLPASKRKIGGLGIFMTKKLMDDVAYEHKDGKNILKLTKELSGK